MPGYVFWVFLPSIHPILAFITTESALHIRLRYYLGVGHLAVQK